MLSWLIRRKIDAFEPKYAYDTAYAGDLLRNPDKLARLRLRREVG